LRLSTEDIVKIVW